MQQRAKTDLRCELLGRQDCEPEGQAPCDTTCLAELKLCKFSTTPRPGADEA